MENPSFEDLNLSSDILKALVANGYEKPSPIQARAIPEILKGKDIFGCAQTGTGKTAAFTLPILQKLADKPKYVENGEFRALILTPTRELAEQVADSVARYSKFLDIKSCKIYGGVSQYAQVRALEKGIDVLIATPGRLLDLYQQKKLSFRGVEFLVLDEADRMLDMGFIHDIRTICGKLPGDRQSLLFSATLAPEVEALASTIVRNPERISIESKSPTVDKIDQKLCFVDNGDKISLLKHILSDKLAKNSDMLALIFCRTKHGANKVANRLSGDEFNAGVIHGNKSQSSRKNALERFKSRESRVLVATDIAARGIDVKAMSLVINYDLPEEAETYVHRIGRTARAEAEGEAISFCTSEEVGLLHAIERFIRKDIAYYKDNPYASFGAQELKESNKKVVYKRAPRGGRDVNVKREDSYGNFAPKKKSNFSKRAPQKKKGASETKPSRFSKEKKPEAPSAEPAKRKGLIAWNFFRKKSK